MSKMRFPSDKYIKNCIYTITNKINGKVYVGKTSRTASERWQEHTQKSKVASQYLARAISKYGKHSFEFCVIDVAESPEMLSHKETFWINQLNTLAPNGYNLKEKDTSPRTEKEKKHLSMVCKGFPKQVTRNDGEIFPSITLAAFASRLSFTDVSNNLAGGRRTTGGYQFKYGEHSAWDFTPTERPKATARKIRRSDGVVFSSITEAAQLTGCNRSGIFKVLAKTASHTHGFTFQYLEENNHDRTR